MGPSLGASLIRSMGGKKFSVRRSRGGSYVNGVWTEDDTGPAILQVLASEQPVNGKDIERIPEGDRVREVRKLYAAQELRPHNERTGAEADVITIRGQEFQVSTVERWQSYWKCLIVSLEVKEREPD